MGRFRIPFKMAYALIVLGGIAIGAVAARAIKSRPVSPAPPIQSTARETATLAEETTILEKPSYTEEQIAGYDAWVAETVESSRDARALALVVSKSDYKLALIDSGEVAELFAIELGGNPVDDKRCEGDQTTPEGIYYVTEKRGEGQTKFYKGLMIDYPNGQDREEFRALKAAGELGPDDTIGGGIMVHGMGSGKPGNDGGMNWTLGCIALSDADMDTVFEAAKVGMPVVITGTCSLLVDTGS